MLLVRQPTQLPHAKDVDMEDFYRQARKIARERRLSKSLEAEQQSRNNESKSLLWPFSSTLSRTPIRRKSSTSRSDRRSSPPASNGSTTPPMRLADLAKQQVMATHVDNWREDMIPVRQHLPMQHIIGSLKRDREEKIKPARRNTIASNTPPSASASTPSESSEPPALTPSLSNLDITARYYNMVSTPSSTTGSSADSFLDLLRTPKSEATSPQPDTDRRFSYQAPEHIAKDIPQSALPGLNLALNLATITPDERDLFSEYAPRDLDDPHMLMDEVVRMRDLMMVQKQLQQQQQRNTAKEEGHGQVVAILAEPEQQDLDMGLEAEIESGAVTNETKVAKDFDEFVNY